MGWTGQWATHFRNGRIDRQAECDSCFTREHGWCEVLKSQMVGTVYYAAVKVIGENTGVDKNGKYTYEPIENPYVFAAVFLTDVKGNEFLVKKMSENEGPCQDHCPASILKLLSPTEEEWAIEWRKRCQANLKKKKI